MHYTPSPMHYTPSPMHFTPSPIHYTPSPSQFPTVPVPAVHIQSCHVNGDCDGNIGPSLITCLRLPPSSLKARDTTDAKRGFLGHVMCAASSSRTMESVLYLLHACAVTHGRLRFSSVLFRAKNLQHAFYFLFPNCNRDITHLFTEGQRRIGKHSSEAFGKSWQADSSLARGPLVSSLIKFSFDIIIKAGLRLETILE